MQPRKRQVYYSLERRRENRKEKKVYEWCAKAAEAFVRSAALEAIHNGSNRRCNSDEDKKNNSGLQVLSLQQHNQFIPLHP